MTDDNGFREYRKLIMSDIKRLDDSFHELHSKLDKISEEVTALKARAGVWGGVGGALGAALLVLLKDFLLP
jgi:hypothetical protein